MTTLQCRRCLEYIPIPAQRAHTATHHANAYLWHQEEVRDEFKVATRALSDARRTAAMMQATSPQEEQKA